MDIREYISSGIIELYVMGLCSPEEEKELEQLRAAHPELDAAVQQYEKDMEKKMLQNSTLPPADVDERILEKLESMNTPVVQMKPFANRWLKPVAAAVAILLGISAFFNYSLYTKNKKQAAIINGTAANTLPPSDYAVITNPAITPVGMYGVGIHSICRCTMFWDKKTGKAYIMIHHLPQSSSSKDYYLWAEVDGKPVNVGIINDEIRGRLIEVPNVPDKTAGFKVSLENAGGNDLPTDIYLSGKI